MLYILGAGDQFAPFQDMDKDNISINSSTLGAQKVRAGVLYFNLEHLLCKNSKP